MSTVKFFVKAKDYVDVMKDIRESGVKFYPVRRWSHLEPSYTFGYRIEILAGHSIETYLMLKYDLVQLD